MLNLDIRSRLGAFDLQVALTASDGVTALFGPSGAGKTATLDAVAGAYAPDEGRIELDGEVLFDKARRINRPMQSRGVGYVFQDARLFPHLSVRRNLGYGAARVRGRSPVARLDEVIGLLGLEGLLGRGVRALSGGEAQRVSIGRALMSQPRLLLMDEPLAALDLARRTEILPYLARLSKHFRLPILYVTHSLSEVVQLADAVALMSHGRMTGFGRLDALALDHPELARRPDAAVRLEGVVVRNAGRMTEVSTPAGAFLLPRLEAAPGEAATLSILARDVLLAVGASPTGLSARNILPARVSAVLRRDDGAALVRLVLGEDAVILSAVTEDALDALSLAPGADVFAVIKSVAVAGGRRDPLASWLTD